MEEKIKVSELPETTSVNDEDIVMIVQDGVNKRTPAQNLKTELRAQNKISFLAPKSSLQEDFGDCSVITGTKNIIVDLSFETNCSTLISYLTDNNINKIDYIVISHFHSDHIGGSNGEGFIKLLSQTNIDFSDCVVLLPHKDISYANFVPNSPSWLTTVEQTIINTLTTNNIKYKYPEEKEIIKIDNNTQMQFFNTDSNFYNDYYNVTTDAYGNEKGYTNYNNFSMVMCYKYYDNYVWFTGDIEKEGQANIYRNINNCDILKVEHHGLNSNSNQDYLNQLNPDYAVVCNRQYFSSPFDFANNTVFNVIAKGCKFFDTRTANQHITFTLKYNKIVCDVETISQINYMGMNLWSGQLIPRGADLNDYTMPGCYYCKNGEAANTLINRPTYYGVENGSPLTAGFKLVVEQIGNSQLRIKQTITMGNDSRSKMFYRTTVEGSFENVPWMMFQPSNVVSMILPNNNIITPISGVTITDGSVIKRNGVATFTLEITIGENDIPSYTDIISFSPDILRLLTNINFLALNQSNSRMIYARTNSGLTSIRTRQSLSANTNYFISFTAISND